MRGIAASAAALALLGVLSCRVGEGATSRGREGTAKQQGTGRDEFFQTSSLQRYVGRTVGELVSELPEPYQEVGPIDEPPGKLIGFALRFANNRRIDVYCFDLKQVERFSKERSWDFETFKKEKISKVVAKP
jgi:hypothetical protein